MYLKAKRQDLVDKEKNEIEIIKEFLPQQLSTDEVEKVCAEAISSSGASSLKIWVKSCKFLKVSISEKLIFH